MSATGASQGVSAKLKGPPTLVTLSPAQMVIFAAPEVVPRMNSNALKVSIVHLKQKLV